MTDDFAEILSKQRVAAGETDPTRTQGGCFGQQACDLLGREFIGWRVPDVAIEALVGAPVRQLPPNGDRRAFVAAQPVG